MLQSLQNIKEQLVDAMPETKEAFNKITRYLADMHYGKSSGKGFRGDYCVIFRNDRWQAVPMHTVCDESGRSNYTMKSKNLSRESAYQMAEDLNKESSGSRYVKGKSIRSFDEGKCPDTGCVQKDSEGNWRIVSNKTGEYWPQKYESEDKANAALAAYHATKHFDSQSYIVVQCLIAKSKGKDVFYIMPYDEYDKLPTHKGLEPIDSGDDKDALTKKWNAVPFPKEFKKFDTLLCSVKVQLMDAPANVKNAFNTLVKYFAKDLESVAADILNLGNLKLNGSPYKIEKCNAQGSNEIAIYIEGTNKILISEKQANDLLAGKPLSLGGKVVTK